MEEAQNMENGHIFYFAELVSAQFRDPSLSSPKDLSSLVRQTSGVEPQL
jgi:hypothetical protein